MLIFSILSNLLFDMVVYCVCLIVLWSFLHHCSLFSIPRASTLSSPGAGDNDFLSRARSSHGYMFVTAGRVKCAVWPTSGSEENKWCHSLRLSVCKCMQKHQQQWWSRWYISISLNVPYFLTQLLHCFNVRSLAHFPKSHLAATQQKHKESKNSPRIELWCRNVRVNVGAKLPEQLEENLVPMSRPTSSQCDRTCAPRSAAWSFWRIQSSPRSRCRTPGCRHWRCEPPCSANPTTPEIKHKGWKI